MRFLTYILVGAGALLAVVAVAIFLLNSGEPTAVAPQTDADQSATTTTTTAALDAAKPDPDPSAGPASAAGGSTSAATSENEGQVGTAVRETSLEIDLAQVKPDGDAVFAGKAQPNSKITIFEGEILLGQTVADGNGEWVVVLDKRLGAGEHLVSIGATNMDGDTELADVTLAISVSDNQDERPLVALLPQTENEIPTLLQSPDDSRIVVGQADTGSEPLPGSGAGKSAAEGAITQASRDDSTAASLPPSVAPRSLLWQPDGSLVVSGVSRGGAVVNAETNRAAFGTAQVTAVGEWQMAGQVDLDRASRLLRFELADAAGNVIASYELPVASRDLSLGLDGSRLVVVQKGDALWRIAYRTYGEGIKYVDIVRRNAAAIGDPDLIFPNQIFAIPE